MQRGDVWFALLGVANSQPILDNGLQNDWETEAAYFVGKAMLEQPATLSRLAREACESFYIGIGQEQVALPSGKAHSRPMWAGLGVELNAQRRRDIGLEQLHSVIYELDHRSW